MTLTPLVKYFFTYLDMSCLTLIELRSNYLKYNIKKAA